MAKSDNLLAILWMLRSRKRMTAAQIADELEVDVRTVYRYIDALSISGAPIIAEPGPNGGYGLLESFRESPLFFTEAERIAIAHAALFAHQSGYPYSRDLSSALTKIERRLSPDQLQELHLHTSGLDVISSGVSEGARAFPDRPRELERRLGTIERAVAESLRLRITHVRELGRSPLERSVDPYGLVYWRESWYLVGYCHLRQDIRMFRCDRIVGAELTEAHFARPADFSVREEFLQVMLPREAATEEVTVRVRGTPYAIDSLTRHWFLGNFVREKSDTEVGLAVDLEEAKTHLPYLVLALAADLTILEPAGLRAQVAELAERISFDHRERESTTDK